MIFKALCYSLARSTINGIENFLGRSIFAIVFLRAKYAGAAVLDMLS